MSNTHYNLIEIETGVPIKAWTKGVKLEDEAKKQLLNVAQLPFVYKWVAAMPDVHWGIGATIGSVIPTKGAIIPAAVGVDIGCFTGDTLVPLLDGKSYPIRELAESGKEVVVYSCAESGKVVAAKAIARKTRSQASLVKVILDNGQEIRCTPDHCFMLRDGSYEEAARLSPGVSLMPLYRQLDREGYHNHRRWVHGYNHEVVAVTPLEEREDVYCLTAPEHHNFALEAGVFVHNCGMMAVQTTLNANHLPDNLRNIRRAIEKAVPHGRTEHGGRRDKGAWGEIPRRQVGVWRQLEIGYKAIIEKYPKLDRGNHVNHLGTLGSGNHFIEVCLDENDQIWFMLHSGSRGVGNRIGAFFIEMAKNDMRAHIKNLPDKDLAYFNEGAEHFDDYVEAVHWAQEFALYNRKLMMEQIVDAVANSGEIPEFELTETAVNCHHNYVAIEEHYGEEVFVTRKGAVRARVGDMGIIPGSMGARSYIVRGLGNPESFMSCSHGAGREMSRNEAKRRFTTADHEKATAGIECRKDEGVLDETPACYKPIEDVMNAQSDLVEVVHTLHQVVCVKG